MIVILPFAGLLILAWLSGSAHRSGRAARVSALGVAISIAILAIMCAATAQAQRGFSPDMRGQPFLLLPPIPVLCATLASSQRKGSPTAAIIGGLLGGVLVVAILVVMILSAVMG